MATVNVKDLSPEVRRRLGVKKPREQRLTQDDIRGYAIAALNPLRDLTRNERRRVLSLAAKLNSI